MKPTALILRTAGTNCDLELARAFELAGAQTRRVHIHRLFEDPGPLRGCDLLGLPGGFSYGDDIAAGRILANYLKHRLMDELHALIWRGVPVVAPCNGFQVLVKAGVLPDVPAGEGDAGGGQMSSAGQRATLADNASGRFIDRWVEVRAERDSPCVWTRGLGEFELPIAHGEGRFVASGAVLDELESTGRAALRYVHNPNGSARDIAGVCDASGLVLGLMPHPERYLDFTNHPSWTRRPRPTRDEPTPGLRMFKNAVSHVTGAVAVG